VNHRSIVEKSEVRSQIGEVKDSQLAVEWRRGQLSNVRIAENNRTIRLIQPIKPVAGMLYSLAAIGF
jgi:hypothetical protein